MLNVVENLMAWYELQEGNVYSDDIQRVPSFVINILHTTVEARTSIIHILVNPLMKILNISVVY